jgi:hypothetical protein
MSHLVPLLEFNQRRLLKSCESFGPFMGLILNRIAPLCRDHIFSNGEEFVENVKLGDRNPCVMDEDRRSCLPDSMFRHLTGQQSNNDEDSMMSYKHHVFISYARVNDALTGWVSSFKQRLEG